MEQTPSTAATINCEWCSKPMNSDAIRCPSCNKLRKDIQKEKTLCYALGGAGFVLTLISLLTRKSASSSDFGYFYGQQSPDNTTSTIFLVLGIPFVIAGIYFYSKVSKKLKTWWWY